MEIRKQLKYNYDFMVPWLFFRSIRFPTFFSFIIYSSEAEEQHQIKRSQEIEWGEREKKKRHLSWSSIPEANRKFDCSR